MKNNHKYNFLLFIPLLIINTISLFNMTNAKLISSVYSNAFIKQLFWIILGFLLIFIIKKVKLVKIFKLSIPLYIISCFLLILVLFIGVDINGAKCWLNIFGFSFQPSELAKLSLTLIMIYIIQKSKCKNLKEEFNLIVKLIIVTIIPSVLVFLEPDTGAITNFLIIFLVVLFSLKLHKRWYLFSSILLLFIIILFCILYLFFQDILINMIGTSLFYRIDRLISFASGNSYQLENALITIGSSSFWGVGINNILLYIPEAPTDFIFAFSIGNYGIFSAILIVISYFIMDIYLIYKANKIKYKSHKIFINCYLGIFIFHQIYNIFMNIGLLPIMGIPLPFLSYGGTNIISNYIFIAIILNIFNQK